jgi:polyhydroxyalkanoate synthase
MMTTSAGAEAMEDPLKGLGTALAPKLAAPQHKPRPLPLFLQLVREQTEGDPERTGRVLAGLRRYQEAPREAVLELMPAIAEIGGASLRDYGGDGPPVLFIPSLINPPNVLDLSRDKSLLRWLSGRGHRVFLLDWGWDVQSRRALSVARHVSEIVLPFIRTLERPPALVGYCLGGTMAIAAAALAKTRSLATIAAPWHFSGFPDEPREMLTSLWSKSEGTVDTLGLLPMEVLQSAFWSLDPARTVGKFERFGQLDPEGAEAKAFVALEDWANDGPPIPEAAARELFLSFLGEDEPGTGQWQVAGRRIDPTRLPCPFLNIVSTTDRIVPHASAALAGERIEMAQGHVGMVVGSRAKKTLWEPLHAWLSRSAPN